MGIEYLKGLAQLVAMVNGNADPDKADPPPSVVEGSHDPKDDGEGMAKYEESIQKPKVLTAEDIERIYKQATKNGSAINRSPKRFD